MTYQEAYQYAIERLKKNAVEDAQYDAWYLIEEITSFKRHDFILAGSDSMPEKLLNRYIALVDKRCLRIPIQHILGYTEFMGLRFYVNDKVLIPRQETELLVEEVKRYIDGCKVLDLCTGSGCIIISLTKLYKIKSAAATDISAEALETAYLNAREHKVDINFIKSNMFEDITEKYDIIVSNPPYIESHIIDELMPEVRFHEPRQALDGGEDGLSFYREIAEKAGIYLNEGGRLLLEIGHNQAEEICKFLNSSGFIDIIVKKDYSGHNRIIHAVNNRKNS